MFEANLVILLLTCLLGSAIGQFPQLCIHNISLPQSSCCPVPPGRQFPCGGPGIGTCKILSPGPVYKPPAIPDWLEDDPRLDWPRRYFKSVCECHGNRDGFMCHLCKFGFYGDNCEKKKPLLVRRNALELNSAERKKLVDTFDRAKYAPSEFVSIVDGFGIDDHRFVNMTVYDHLIHVHYMATKNPVVGNESVCLIGPEVFSGNFKTLDFGHNGPGFMTWHRLFLMLMERELGRLIGDPLFALAYWRWPGEGTECSVCTDDLAGATNTSSTPRKTLRSGSPFSRWKAVCQLISKDSNCTVYPCDLSQSTEPVIREPGEAVSPHLPLVSDVIHTLSQPIFDLYPYNPTSSPKSFRNCIEGYAGARGAYRGTGFTYTHVQVHTFFGGQISQVPNSPDDPLFFFHHTYIDKLFEMWLRMHNATYEVFPENVAAGHNLHDYIVPVLPLHRHIDFFRSSLEIGYDYDDTLEMEWVREQHTDLHAKTHNNGWSFDNASVVYIAAVALVAIVVATLVLVKRKIERRREWSPVEEAEPLIF